MYQITDLKPGTAIQINNESYTVVSSRHSKQARGGAVMRTTLKNLLTGTIIQKTFQGNDKIEPAEAEYSRAQYLYNDGNEYYFMDSSTYDQFSFSKKQLGDLTNYLTDGIDVDIQNINGKPANIKLPPKINLKVIETEPGVKGDTASGGTKPAKLETGTIIHVPLFINTGDTVRVNTETGQYVERV